MYSLEELVGLGLEFEDFNSRVVIVWNPQFVPTILVKVIPSKSTDRAGLLLDGVKVPLEVLGIGGRHNVSSVVTVASNYDVCSLVPLHAHLGIESIREAGRHIWHGHGEFILETSCQSVLSESSGHPITRERVGPNTIISVLLLMIVDHELLDAVIVQIVVGDGVSGQDCCVDHAGGN